MKLSFLLALGLIFFSIKSFNLEFFRQHDIPETGTIISANEFPRDRYASSFNQCFIAQAYTPVFSRGISYLECF